MRQIIILMSLLLAACTPSAAPPTVAPTDVPTTESIVPTVVATAAEEAAAPAPEESSDDYNGPTWADLPIVDSRTGETFTLADFAGKTVFVEPMATWCTNCRYQLPNVAEARNQLNSDEVVFISFSVGENVDDATLAAYADGQGWTWTFAVASEALMQGMVDTFGRTVISPPATPHFIIRPDGSLTDLATGSHLADALLAEIAAARGA